MAIIVTGLLLGGTYALIAMGLQLQYGVARIMNLANGEILVAGAFAAFWFYTGARLSPFLSIVVVAPIAFVNQSNEKFWTVGQWQNGTFYGVSSTGRPGAKPVKTKPSW